MENNNNLLEELVAKQGKYNPTTLRLAVSSEIDVSKDHFYKLLKNDKHLIRSIKVLHLFTDYPVGELIGYDKNLDTVIDTWDKKKEDVE